MTHRGIAPFIALTLLSLAPSVAAASNAVILPRVGGSGVGAAPRDEAMGHLRRTLENEGWTLYDIEDVSTALPPELSACGPDDQCAWRLREMLDADVAIGLRVWGTEDQVERLAVVVTGVRGVGQRTLAVVDETLPLPFAVAEAARAAVQTWSSGALEPGGAPSTEPLAPGPQSHLDGSPLNWFLGGLLVLGSAPMLGYAINTAVRHGDCTEGETELCTRRVRFEEGAGLFMGIGAAVLISGVVVLALQPIRVAVSATEDSAAIQVEGRF